MGMCVKTLVDVEYTVNIAALNMFTRVLTNQGWLEIDTGSTRLLLSTLLGQVTKNEGEKVNEDEDEDEIQRQGNNDASRHCL